MEDKLIKELQARFTGHEAGVDPGLWEAISGQLAAATGTDLQEVLRDKFAGHEVEVDPQVWGKISARTGQGGATGGVSTSWIAGGLGAAALLGGLIWWASTGGRPETAPVGAGSPALAVEAAAPIAEVVPAAEAATRSQAPVAGTSGTVETPSPAAAMPPAAPTTADEGPRTVQEVLGALMEQNAAEPHFPDRPEPLPPAPAKATDRDDASPAVQRPAGSTRPEDRPAPTATLEAQDPVVQPAHGVAEEEAAEEMDEATDAGSGSAPAPQVFIPNVFSPQGDGINDKLKVVGTNFQKVSVRIISARSDAVVFRANNLDDQWNGRDMNNVPCEEGYYFYAIEVTGRDGLTYSMGEVIRLFR